jgi:hypothetical protein
VYLPGKLTEAEESDESSSESESEDGSGDMDTDTDANSDTDADTNADVRMSDSDSSEDEVVGVGAKRDPSECVIKLTKSAKRKYVCGFFVLGIVYVLSVLISSSHTSPTLCPLSS